MLVWGVFLVNFKTSGPLWNGAERSWRTYLGKGLLNYYYPPTEELNPDLPIAALEPTMPLLASWDKWCLACGAGHHHVLINSTSLLRHFQCYSVSVLCNPQERCSTVCIRSVGRNIFPFQKHPPGALMPISGCPRRKCSTVFIRVLGAISLRS